jgi:dUTP pyrophosphatase
VPDDEPTNRRAGLSHERAIFPAVQIDVSIQRLAHAEGLGLPAYETTGSAGMDLRAAVDESVLLAPGARAAIPTGLRLAIPDGYEGQVRPRSGWAMKSGISCVNAVGTIDSDYRGELRVPLINLGQDPVRIERGMRIAQIVFAPIARARWIDVGALDATTRGQGGFGHTGRR